MNAAQSMLVVRDASGTQLRVHLGQLIGQGGAGSVYLSSELPGSVIKIYGPSNSAKDLESYARKLEAMLEVPPDLVDLGLDGQPYNRFRGGEQFVQIAWPTSTVHDIRGNFLGYVMPSVVTAGTASLESVMDDRDAQQLGMSIGIGHRVTLAAQLAKVISQLHAVGHYLVDLKPVNLNFYKKTLFMAILDCDGFSICGKKGRFEASQHTEDYLAPEFQATGDPNRDPQAQDRFGLGVIIFRLLNLGIHPFAGRPLDNSVPNEQQEKIAQRLYPYGLTPHARVAPLVKSVHECIPDDLRVMFDKTFIGKPAQRPPAKEWADILETYARRQSGRIVQCASVPAHWHFAGMACSQCLQEAMRNALLAPVKPKRGRPRKPTPGMAHASPPALSAHAMAAPAVSANPVVTNVAVNSAFCIRCGNAYDPTDPYAQFCDQCQAPLPNQVLSSANNSGGVLTRLAKWTGSLVRRLH